jgi:uncharacterized protein YkwD
MKRFISMVMVLLLLTSLVACGNTGDVDEAAAMRDIQTADTSVIYIDDEAIALAGSIADASMTEEERAEANELRAMAVDAFNQCNALRQEQGLKTLDWDDTLELCAGVRSAEMVSTFSHTRPNGNPWWTVNSEIMYGENLAKGFSTAEGAVNGWMNSPTHKANLMDASFNTMSIAIYKENGVLHFAQEFGY